MTAPSLPGLAGHNPDILTCLANLSADEVFTPPKFASAMLDILPQDLFRQPDTTFLDPVCKSGVFLREIARRLNEGLRDQMPDEQARIDHILTKQVFGLAITELTALLSISLGIINILPIPALDGGRLMFVVIEWVRRGKRISPRKEGLVHLVGFALLLGLIVVISYFDIVRLWNGDSLIN